MQVCESIGNTPAATNVADGWMMIFPGQGSPAIGMGSDVCDVSPGTKAVWDCASDVSGLDVRKLCQKGPMTRLTKTLYQQLAVTTVNAAMLTLLRERTPVLETGYAGHSAGEYTALYAAGVMDLETLFRAITLREQIDNLGLGTVLNVCCDNGHQQQVVGGELTAVKTLVNHLARHGVNTIKLGVNGAWHTPLMHDGVAQMRQALADLPFSAPVCPLIMNSSGKAEYDVAQIKENLALHLIHTVRWRESMDRWAQMGHRRYLEISNKKILSHLLAEHYGADEDYHIQHYYHIVGSSVKHAG